MIDAAPGRIEAAWGDGILPLPADRQTARVLFKPGSPGDTGSSH